MDRDSRSPSQGGVKGEFPELSTSDTIASDRDNADGRRGTGAVVGSQQPDSDTSHSERDPLRLASGHRGAAHRQVVSDASLADTLGLSRNERPILDQASPRGTVDRATISLADTVGHEQAMFGHRDVAAKSPTDNAGEHHMDVASDRSTGDAVASNSADDLPLNGTIASSPHHNSEANLEQGTQIGRLKILRKLGAGAIGVVYAAYDPTLDREVAVKLIRGGQDSPAARVRLVREAQALAKLTHPNVVAVHDAGTHRGQVWLSMEFVIGRTLRDWIATEKPNWQRVLAVVMQAGQGIAAAHSEGLLHRDIKPDNLMVGDDERVRVMDFGLARAEEPDERTRNLVTHPNVLSVELTAVGAILGTPAYMAPEQYSGLIADERTDEYAFAVTLWEALYRGRPYVGETFAELSHAVLTGKREPVPSDINVPTWLRRILERALSVDRYNRYESVRVMLDAIEAQLQRARNRRIVSGLAAGLVVMAVLGVFAVIQWRAAAANEARARGSEAEVRAQTRVLEDRNAALVAREAELKQALSVQLGLRAKMLIPEDSEGEALKLGVQAVGAYAPDWDPPPPTDASDALAHVLADDTLIVHVARVLEGHSDQIWHAVYSPDGSRIASIGRDPTGRIWDARTGELMATLAGHVDDVRSLSFSPDGSRIVTGSRDKTVRIWDTQTGNNLHTVEGHTKTIFDATFSPDGSQIATASSDQTARIWDPQTGEPIATLKGHRSTIRRLVYSPDGRRILTGSNDRTAKIWDPQTGDHLTTLEGHSDTIYAIAYSPDGSRIVTGSGDKTTRIWDAASGEHLATLKGHEHAVFALAFSPDSSQLTTASLDYTARIWDLHTGDIVAVLKHENALAATVYSPDGSHVATASFDATVKIWDTRDGNLDISLQGHDGGIRGLAYSPDGSHLATAGLDHTLRIWDTHVDAGVATIAGHRDTISGIEFSPDGTRITTISHDATTRFWDAKTGDIVTVLRGHEKAIVMLNASPDGSRFATASSDKTVRIWQADNYELITTIDCGIELYAMAFSPDGSTIATIGPESTARLWNAQTGDPVRTLEGHKASLNALVFSPDGSRIATASNDETAALWNANTGELLASLQGHEHYVSMVAFSPDGSRVATCSYDKTANIWDAHTGQHLATLEGHESDVLDLVYSPDGSRIATVSKDKTLRIWDAQTGESIATSRGHDDTVFGVVYSPDGTRLATASADTTSRIWDAATGALQTTLRGHSHDVFHVAFSPDGNLLATACVDGTAKVWNADTGAHLLDLRDRIGLPQPDGSIQWPIPPRELTRLGCERLKQFEKDYLAVRDICGPLVGIDESSNRSVRVLP